MIACRHNIQGIGSGITADMDIPRCLEQYLDVQTSCGAVDVERISVLRAAVAQVHAAIMGFRAAGLQASSSRIKMLRVRLRFDG